MKNTTAKQKPLKALKSKTAKLIKPNESFSQYATQLKKTKKRCLLELEKPEVRAVFERLRDK